MRISAFLSAGSAFFVTLGLEGCGRSAPPRLPEATIYAARLPPPPPAPPARVAGFSARARGTLELTVRLPADDTRRSVRVWIADAAYHAAYDELCRAMDEPDLAGGGESEVPEEEVAAWRRSQLLTLRERCTPGAPFTARTVTLEGPGVESTPGWLTWTVSLDLVGQIPLGAPALHELEYAAQMGGDDTPFSADDVREVTVEGGPISLPASAFAPGHEQRDLFEVDGVLLPQRDGRYVRAQGEVVELDGLVSPITLGWTPVKLLRDDKAGVSLLAYADRIAVKWPSGREVFAVDAQLARHGLSAVKILDVTTRGPKTFALLSVATMTRGRATGGFCGDGREVDWLWLELDATIEKYEHENVASCASSISVEESERGPVLVARRTAARDQRVDCVTYDRRRPDLAFGQGRTCAANKPAK